MTDSAPYSSPAAPIAQPVDAKVVARTILLVLGTLGAVTIALVFSLIWVFSVDLPLGGVLVGIVASVLLLILLPVIAFSLSANWAFGSSAQGRRVLAQVIWGISAGQLVCLVAVLVLAVVTSPPVFVTITIVACGVAFGIVGILLGRVLRSKPVETPVIPLVGWTPPPTGKRDVVPFVAVGVFLIFAVLALVVTQPWNFANLDPRATRFAVAGLLLLLDLGFLAAMIACLVRVMTTAAALKVVTSRDYAQARRIRRAIYRRRVSELEPLDVPRARATAILSAPQLRWQIAFNAGLFAAIALGQLSTGITSSFVFGFWFSGTIAVLGILAVGLIASRLVVVQRYIAAQPSAETATAL